MENRFLILDALRGFAAIYLLLFHLLRVYEDPSINFLIQLGRIGTDIFFVMSGFLSAIAVKSVLSGRRKATDFLITRVHRIYLVYFFSLITVAIAIPIAIGVISSFKTASLKFEFVDFSLIDWAKIITLVKVFDSSEGMLYKAFLPLNGVYWFIAVILQIYCFIFFCLLFKRYFYLVASIGCIISIALFNPSIDAMIPSGVFLNKFHEFYFGMASFWFHRHLLKTNKTKATLIIILIVITVPISDVILQNEEITRSFWALLLAIAIPYLLIIGSTAQGNRTVRFFGKVGLFSFSIYLIHAPLIPLADMLARNLTPLHPEQYLPLMAAPLIMIFCYIWSIFFERPGSIAGTFQVLRHPLKSVFKNKTYGSKKIAQI